MQEQKQYKEYMYQHNLHTEQNKHVWVSACWL